ncbi:flippase-like domain-containing protein, partial [bacterium]|nr:flippase-like domain-containing protein [bacterium]
MAAKRKTLLFAVKILVSALILWIVYRFLGTEETWQNFKQADFGWIAAGAACVVAVQIIKAWRFRELGLVLDRPIPFYRCLLAHLIVPILGFVTPGKLGEGAKIFYLKSSKRELGFLFIVERIQDLLMLLAVAGLGFAFSDLHFISYLVLAGVVIGGTVVFLKLDWFLNKITRLLLKKQYFTENWFLERTQELMKPRFLFASSLTLLVWAMTFGSSFCFARSVDISLSYPKIALVFSWAVIMGLLSSLPGGVGVREGGITVLMDSLYAVPRAVGSALAAINLAVHYAVLSLTAVIG